MFAEGGPQTARLRQFRPHLDPRALAFFTSPTWDPLWRTTPPPWRSTRSPENTLVGRALGCLASAFSTREAVSLEGRFRHQNGTEMLYRAVGLPFLDVGGRLSYVVCAIGGKAV